jgi:hypothetical protein
MAINTNPLPGQKLLATYNSSGNFVTPAGVNTIFVGVRGGGGGGGGAPYSHGGQGSAGGGTFESTGFVNVIPGTTYIVTVGAGGTGGATNGSGNSTGGQAGGSGGTSAFDTPTISVTGGNGGGTNANSPGNSGAATVASSLPNMKPSANALARVFSVANTAVAGGNRGSADSRYGARISGGTGTAGQVVIYG